MCTLYYRRNLGTLCINFKYIYLFDDYQIIIEVAQQE